MWRFLPVFYAVKRKHGDARNEGDDRRRGYGDGEQGDVVARDAETRDAGTRDAGTRDAGTRDAGTSNGEPGNTEATETEPLLGKGRQSQR